MVSSPKNSKAIVRRSFGFAFGIGTQALFAVTVVGLFSFLRFGVTASSGRWFFVDLALALQFAVPHSILLHPATRQKLRPWISTEFYGAFFCVCTCVSLLLIFACWHGTNRIVWELEGIASYAMLFGFFASWAALLYSISLTGLGYQTGWTQWLHWHRGEKMARRNFVARGVYRWLRHPIYLSFLGLIWFTSTMTLDHAMLTGLWTIYIGIGSLLKDRRMLFYLNDAYAGYMEKVPGYPLVFIGPLARRSGNSSPSADSTSIAIAMPGLNRLSSPAVDQQQQRNAA